MSENDINELEERVARAMDGIPRGRQAARAAIEAVDAFRAEALFSVGRQVSELKAALGGRRKIMAMFRKKPVVIEAVQWNGSMQDVIDFIGQELPTYGPPHDGALRIQTLEGDHACLPGDWIIRGIKGELYPCKPDIFAATYDPV